MASTMLARISQKHEREAFRRAVRKGGLRCPSCGAACEAPEVMPEHVLDCPECGSRSAAADWAMMRGAPPRGWADRPPPDTAIQRHVREDGSIHWDIPASGKSGGFLSFALFWCATTGIVSLGFGAGLLFGKPHQTSHSVPPWLIGLLLTVFFGLFWTVGFGMFYAAARNKWAQTSVGVTGDEVILTRHLFGRVSENRVSRNKVDSVTTEVFYQKNQRPVYGIAIKAGKRKLKFGSMLREDEVGWLAADLRRVLLGEVSAARRNPGARRVPSSRAFSLPIPSADRQLWSLAIMLTIIGLGFFALGIFVIRPDDDFGQDGPAGVRVFNSVFSLSIQGFRTVWLLFNSAITAAGVWLLVKLIRRRGVERRFEGDATVVAIRRVRRGLVLSQETFPRPDVRDLSTSSNGHSNGRPMSRIDLQVGDQSKTLAHWVESSAADAFVTEASGFLWEA